MRGRFDFVRLAPVVVAVAVAGCSSAPATTSPATSPATSGGPGSSSAAPSAPLASASTPAGSGSWTAIPGSPPLVLTVADSSLVGLMPQESSVPVTPVFWWATDGMSWTKASLAGAEPGFVLAAASRPARTVAVGVTGCSSWVVPDAACSGAVWLTDDARSWRRLPTTAPLQQAQMLDVTAYPDGFLAVGSGVRDGLAWRSTTGEAWERVSVSGLAGAQLTHVAWTGERFVAIGFVIAPRSDTGIELVATPQFTSAIWASSDGTAWGEIGRAQSGSITWTDLAVSGARVIVRDSMQSAIYSSLDGGASWANVSLGLEPYARIDAIAGSSYRFAALVLSGTGIIVMSSPDGRSWTQLPAVPSSADVRSATVALQDADLIVTGTLAPGLPMAGWRFVAD